MHASIPSWLRILVRLDFVAAVALTVVAPLLLLTRALRQGSGEQRRALLRYWRSASLLMVTVYLLAGERRVAFAAGLAARLLIARTLVGKQQPDPLYQRWAQVTGGYCLIGSLASVPLVRGLRGGALPLACRAYIEPAQEYATLVHHGVGRSTLGRIGMLGMYTFFAGACAFWLSESLFETLPPSHEATTNTQE